MSQQAGRIAPIDRLRGLVLVVMALDHCRDFVAPSGVSPENLETTTLGFFAVRWVTHFCAPVFLLLAGTGAALSDQRSGDRRATARWLATRGLWLMFLEVTWMNFMWFFNVHQIHLGVLWAIGGSMVLLAGFLALGAGRTLLGLVGAGGLVGLAIWPVSKGAALAFLFQPMWFENSPFGGLTVMSVYVVVPWFLVMALGWWAAHFLSMHPRGTALAGVGLFGLFLVLRLWHLVPESAPWEGHERGLSITLVDFLNPQKYPPSLLFVLMTLGPALALLPLLQKANGRLGAVLETFGRVPLFFYLLHVPLYHLAGIVQAQGRFGVSRVPGDEPVSYLWLFGVWLLILLLLWPVCVWWRGVKGRRRESWVRFL